MDIENNAVNLCQQLLLPHFASQIFLTTAIVILRIGCMGWVENNLFNYLRHSYDDLLNAAKCNLKNDFNRFVFKICPAKPSSSQYFL